MPAATTTLRVLVFSVIALFTVSGCQTLDDAGRVLGRSDLVNDVAARMDQAMESTYLAEYQLAGGESASIAQEQKPARTAYTYPGGKLTVTREATTECETASERPVCTVVEPPASGPPSVAVFAEAKRRGLVTPPVVVGLLTAAALEPAAVIEQSDTTLAGYHATCVQVSQVPDPFSACVTTEGVLGSFTGDVEGKRVELALTRYANTVDQAAFEVPSGAGVVDQRPTDS
ncbi:MULTISPECIES: hypothetical protein [Micromonospora]|uniref:Lipoprotein n=1 Tax=Micromonospora yangpuensis TaxID=683228 RepID=A0A1C6U6Y3_9ACTN|nr:hypothetical protein [Micromonospora yangpuensis]GGL90655.1 hypothetical protein GCM10012279_05580 [Micromonospora yangpuensis]SCL49688.1 hypothetical protein GA0070617_1256 [Micromonospora yangpuensis]